MPGEIEKLGKKYIMNTYSRFPFAIVRGDGVRVWDDGGKEYLDFIGGLAVNILGHAHPRITEALYKQAQKLIHCSNLYWIVPQVELAGMLVQNSAMDKVFFCNSGGEANEGAIKLVRKYMRKKGYREKFEIITCFNSFHGRTLGTLALTGQEKFRKDFEPLPEGFKHVPLNDINALEREVSSRTCALMVEPVQGEGGVYPAEPEYLKYMREICDDNGMLLIFDEVQCGMGRTGNLFAYQHYGVEPDIITLAKGMANGIPIGALLARDGIAESFAPGDHGSTFGGNPLACAAGLETMKVLLEEGILENVRRTGDYFRKKLLMIKNKYEIVKEIRGLGFMLAVELQRDGNLVSKMCCDRGLLVNSIRDSILRFLPPLITTREDVDIALNILDGVLAEASNTSTI